MRMMLIHILHHFRTMETPVMVGLLGNLEPTLNTAPMVMGRKSLAGSVIGAITETQELLDFCGHHGSHRTLR